MALGIWQRFSPLQYHPHTVPGLQDGGKLWLQLDRMPGDKPHLPLLGQGSDEQYPFRPRKAFTNALSGAAPEREIGVRRTSRFSFRRMPLRVKAERIGKIPRVVMHDVLAYENKGADWKDIAAGLIIV